MRNKPVMTAKVGSLNHLRILNSTAFVYNDAKELLEHISRFVKFGVPANRDYNAYRSYYPEPVMARFKAVFLDPIFNGKSSSVKVGPTPEILKEQVVSVEPHSHATTKVSRARRDHLSRRAPPAATST